MASYTVTDGEHDAEQDNTGFVHDQLGDHSGAGTLQRGLPYGSLTRGLVTYYSLDNSNNDTSVAEDATPLGNDGTINGAVYNSSGQVGDDSLSFDGTDDYVSVPYSADFGTSEFTVSYWVNTDNSSIDSSEYHASNYDDSTGWFLQGYQATDGYRFWLDGTQITSGSLDSGSWHHIVGVRRESEIFLYEDGVELDTASVSTENASSSSDVFVGSKDESSNHLDGSLDDVRIYDRALSQPEIEALAGLTATQVVSENDTL